MSLLKNLTSISLNNNNNNNNSIVIQPNNNSGTQSFNQITRVNRIFNSERYSRSYWL